MFFSLVYFLLSYTHKEGLVNNFMKMHIFSKLKPDTANRRYRVLYLHIKCSLLSFSIHLFRLSQATFHALPAFGQPLFCMHAV